MSTNLSIATWNVNSIRSRLPGVLDWLRSAKPDVVLLQEIKCIDEAFPAMQVEDCGYNIALFGQKTYNGVAILSKYPLEEVVRGLPGDDGDTESRYIEALVSVHTGVRPSQLYTSLRVASIYVPNGQSPESDKFAYKLRFYDRLREHAAALLAQEELLVLGGDYNVAPQALDVYNPKRLEGTVCFHPLERAKFHALSHLGLIDAYRALYPDVQAYSWWDYRGGSLDKNEGLRIDHLLCSPKAADRLQAATIDTGSRHQEKASDHAPVIATFKL